MKWPHAASSTPVNAQEITPSGSMSQSLREGGGGGPTESGYSSLNCITAPSSALVSFS